MAGQMVWVDGLRCSRNFKVVRFAKFFSAANAGIRKCFKHSGSRIRGYGAIGERLLSEKGKNRW